MFIVCFFKQPKSGRLLLREGSILMCCCCHLPSSSTDFVPKTEFTCPVNLEFHHSKGSAEFFDHTGDSFGVTEISKSQAGLLKPIQPLSPLSQHLVNGYRFSGCLRPTNAFKKVRTS
jgi:hypothetical protein